MARVLLVFFLLGSVGSLVLAAKPEEVVGLEFMVGTLMSPDTQDHYGVTDPFLTALEVPEGGLSALG